MKNFYITFVLNFIAVLGIAQTVSVVDKANLQPIENVFVFSKDKSVITNKKGEANISNFGKNEILTFQHASFENYTISYEDLEQTGFKIKLSESVLNLNEVVVSVNRWEQNKKEVPNKITMISAKEIAFTNPKRKEESKIPKGERFPSVEAAIAINPLPAVISRENQDTYPIDRYIPAIEPNNPDNIRA